MTSLPTAVRPRQGSIIEDMKEEQLDNFSIRPELRRIRHIQSVSLYNVRIEPTPVASDLRRNASQRSLTKGDASKMSRLLDLSKANGPEHSKNAHTSELRLLDSQVQKQLAMHDMNKRNFLQCFYTLSSFLQTEQPYYISRVFGPQKVVQEDLNFDAFNEKACSVSVFAEIEGCWKMLIQYHVKLSLLVNVGDDLERIESSIPDTANFLLLELVDGCYYLLPDNPIFSPDTVKTLQEGHRQRMLDRFESLYHSEQPTCSYDQIMKLDNLSMCIRDLLEIKKSLRERIDAQLPTYKNSSTARQEAVVASRTRVAALRKMLEAQKATNQRLKSKIESQNRRMTEEHPAEDRVDFSSLQEQLGKYLVQLDESSAAISQQKSRIAKDLLTIFPIIPSTTKPSSSKYNFELFGMRFPNTSSTPHLVRVLNKLSRSQMANLNALIGYLVLIISQLARYLSVSLRYPLRFLGSNSYIHDPISRTITKNRLFPLFITQNSMLILRFSYGLVLLTRNLDQLFQFENLYKVAEFNLLVNVKIFLTCLESYNGRSNVLSDLISGRTVEQDDDDNDGMITHDKLNRTLLREQRTNHIRRHLLGHSDYE